MIDINTLSGIEFENLCVKLLEKMGFQTQTTKASGDGGIDIIAFDERPFHKSKCIVQCKRYTGNVGEPYIRDLYGVVMAENANKGMLITTASFTNAAISFASGKQIELIDGEQLLSLMSINSISTQNPVVDQFALAEIRKEGLNIVRGIHANACEGFDKPLHTEVVHIYKDNFVYHSDVSYTYACDCWVEFDMFLIIVRQISEVEKAINNCYYSNADDCCKELFFDSISFSKILSYKLINVLSESGEKSVKMSVDDENGFMKNYYFTADSYEVLSKLIGTKYLDF